MNDILGQSLPQQDIASQMPRQVTTHLSSSDIANKTEPQYALDLYQVASLFDEAGLPRNRRSLSRYCTVGKLDCQKVETLNGEEWRVDEQSVHRLTAQIQQQESLTHVDSARHDTSSHEAESQIFAGQTSAGHDQTLPDTPSNVTHENTQQAANDMTGHSKTADDLSSTDQPIQNVEREEAKPKNSEPDEINKFGERLVIQMERENDLLRDQLEKKDNQIENKDKQIDDLIERGREDKMLIQNFQRKLGMLNAPKEDRPSQNYTHPDQNHLPWQGTQVKENTPPINPDWSGPDDSVDNSRGRL